jgi:hypothetical protein
MQNPADTTNPGLVNVADQGDGLLSVDQPVTASPSYNAGAGNTVVAANGGLGAGVFTVTDPNDARAVTEVFGLGLPTNVFV